MLPPTYEQIPSELKALPQWVVAREDAVPLQARNGRNADKTCAHHWCDYETAINAGYPYIGFCLTPSDPYVVIDLDDKEKRPATPEVKAFHHQLIAAFGSYTEVSRSGRGYHIIVRGKLPSGRRKDSIGVEVYPAGAYVILTGAHVSGTNAAIVDGQAGIDWLVANVLDQEGSAASAYEVGAKDYVQSLTDQELLNKLVSAQNAEKSYALWTGNWQALGYSSQSQADMALMDMLCYYTVNDEQCRRMFRYSALGQREKAQRDDYLNGMIAKKRSELVSLEAIQNMTPAPLEGTPTPTPVPAVATVLQDREAAASEPEHAPSVLAGAVTPAPWAPGALGWLQHYIYSSSERPVQDISLVATIGVLAGMLGRYYNIGGTGLNQYLLLLAETGVGKDELTRAPERLFSQVRETVPSIDVFRGPASFASGQALAKRLVRHPCFFSVLGEWGQRFREMESPHAIGALHSLKTTMLAVYNSSGQHQVLQGTVYSDEDKNSQSVSSPSLTIMCETAPNVLLSSLSLEHISNGLLPRFLTFDYRGARPPANRNSGAHMDAGMRQWFVDIATVALTQQQRQQALPVNYDSQAAELLGKCGYYDTYCDDQINSSSEADIARHLWNRAHLKAVRLAALCAAASSPHNPIITREYAEWAINLVTKDVQTMSDRFSSGDIGHGDGKQLVDVRRVLWDFNRLRTEAPQRLISAYKVPSALAANGIVPYSYLQRRTASLSSFTDDRRGSGAALDFALKQLVATGEIIELDKIRLSAYGFSGRAFSVNFG